MRAYFLTGKGAVPDLDGCKVAFGDLLQRAGIISNDRWIASWDGSAIVEWREHNQEPCTVACLRRMDKAERDAARLNAEYLLKLVGVDVQDTEG